MNTSTNHYRHPLYTEPMKIGDFEITPNDLLEHVFATGGTGSGKTRSFLLPCVEAVLNRFGNDPDQRAGMVLIDAKGDMAELAGECIRRSGRKDEPYILGAGGNCWFSIFDQFGGDPTAVANFLFDTLEDRTGRRGVSANESFWEENARRLLRSASICAKAVHGKSMGNISGIREAINLLLSIKHGYETDNDDEVITQSPRALFLDTVSKGFREGLISHGEYSDVKEYVERDMLPGASTTWGTISNMARNYVTQFSQPALQDLFRPGGGREKIIPEEIIDRGVLLIVSLSPVIYGDAATPFRIALKKAFFQRILQRNHLVIGSRDKERLINQNRPILCVMDEFHTTLTPGGRGSEAYFLDRAREFRCMCILASQGISAISSVIPYDGVRDHLLNNCRTKFFFANDCPQTLEYFETLGGTDYRMVRSMNYQPLAAPPRFRLPNHRFAAAPATVFSGFSIDRQKEPRFSSSELGSLPNGTAFVVKKGRKLVTYTRDPGLYASEAALSSRP